MTHSSIHKVLIVDDNEVFSHSAERHLKREGFEVFVAHDGNTAKSMVLAAKSDGYPFDLVVAEFFMPNMQGVDLVRCLHQHFPALSVLMSLRCSPVRELFPSSALLSMLFRKSSISERKHRSCP